MEPSANPINPLESSGGPSSVPTPAPDQSSTSNNIPVNVVPPATPIRQPGLAVEPTQTQPENPMTGIVVGGDGGLGEGLSGGPVSGSGDPAQPYATGSGNSRSKKPFVIGGVLALLVIGSASAYYFGYYSNPSVIYSQSLKNTGKGYDKLVDYVNAQSKIKYKGSEGNGSFTYKSSSFSTDGSLVFKGDQDNGEVTFDAGVGTGRINADIRFLKSTTKTPDIYVKAGGLKALSGLLGTPELDAATNKYDNTWIAVDHTVIDNLGGTLANQISPMSSPTNPSSQEVLDEARAFGKVNQEYLFSSDKNKAVTTVVKKYGMETTNGHKVYHYKVALVKDNVKKYITAQQTALNASKLGAWLKKNNYQDSLKPMFDSMQEAAKKIKTSDTFDVYADVGKHLIYKLRFTNPKDNPAENFVDVGLDYKGGSEYPFFISGQSKQDKDLTTALLTTTVNTKTNSVDLKLNVKTGSSEGGTLTSQFTFKPTNNIVKIDKPAGAKQLSEVLKDLGLGDVLGAYSQPTAPAAAGAAGGGVYGGIQSKARNSKRQSDISSLQTQLEAYFSQNGNYPSLTDMNSPSWLVAHMKSLDQNSLVDPSSPTQSKKLLVAPAPNAYAYSVTNAAGKSCESKDTDCTKYTLTATLEGTLNGATTYTKKNLD